MGALPRLKNRSRNPGRKIASRSRASTSQRQRLSSSSKKVFWASSKPMKAMKRFIRKQISKKSWKSSHIWLSFPSSMASILSASQVSSRRNQIQESALMILIFGPKCLKTRYQPPNPYLNNAGMIDQFSSTRKNRGSL